MNGPAPMGRGIDNRTTGAFHAASGGELQDEPMRKTGFSVRECGKIMPRAGLEPARGRPHWILSIPFEVSWNAQFLLRCSFHKGNPYQA